MDILDRLEERDTGPVFRVNGVAWSDLRDRLEAGDLPLPAARALGLTVPDVLAGLAHEGLGRDGNLGPTLVRQAPVRPALAAAISERALAGLLSNAGRDPALGALVAGLTQILDAWDASHDAAQSADDRGDTRFAPYWHAIAHRREPDFSNAAYWLRRVGRHPIFGAVASTVAPLLKAHGDPALETALLPGGTWDPMAFLDVCRRAGRDPRLEPLARRIQRAEMRVLLTANAMPLMPTIGITR